jgi:hypothetical protein
MSCEVFCDRCGDCIRCFGDDPCYDDGKHSYDEADAVVEPAADPLAGTSDQVGVR